MNRQLIPVTFLAISVLCTADTEAASAVRKRAVRIRREVASSVPASPGPPTSTAARNSHPRLCSAARSPADTNPEEKAALEIPDMRDLVKLASVVEALQKIKGVKSAVGDINTHLAVVDYDPRVAELDHFLTACKEAGFDASEYRVESRFPKPIKLKGG